MSLPQNTPEKRTFGQLYDEISKKGILSPSEKAMFDKKMIESGFAARREEIITSAEIARKELSEALGNIAGKDSILAKLQDLLPGSPTPPDITSAKKSLSTGIDRLASATTGGAVTEVLSETAESLAAQAGASGKALATAATALTGAGSVAEVKSGVEGLTKAIQGLNTLWSTAWKTIGDLFSSFMKMLGLDKLFGTLSGKDSESPSGGVVQGVGAKVEETTRGAKKTAEEILGDKEQAKEKLLTKYWDSFVKSGWIADKSKYEDFKKVFLNHWATVHASTLEALQNATDPEKEWNASETVLQVTSMPFKLIAELISQGIIPKSAIAAQVVDSSVGGIRLYLQSPYTLITKGPSAVLIELGTLNEKDFSQMTQAERDITIMAMHHTMTGPLWLAGKLSSTIATIGLMGLYWDQGIGVEKAKGVIDATRGDFSKAVNRLQTLITMLGGDKTGDLKEYAKSLTDIVDEVTLKTQIAEIHVRLSKQGKNARDIAQAIEELPLVKNGAGGDKLTGLLRELRTSGQDAARSLTEMSTFMESPMAKGKTLAGIEGLIKGVKNQFTLGELDLLLARATEQKNAHLRTLKNVVQYGDIPAIAQWMNRARLGISQAKLMESLEKGHLALHVKDGNEAKSAMQQLLKGVPKGLEHLFNGLAITLVIADMSTKEDTGDKLATLAKGIASLNPLYGGPILIYEGATMQGSIPTKSGYLILGGIVSVLGVKELGKVISNPSWGRLGAFLVSPVTTTWNTGTATLRGTQYMWNLVRYGRGIAQLPKGLGAGFATAGAILAYLTYENLLSDKSQKAMLEAGIMEKDGTFAHGDKLHEGWKKLKDEDKPKVLQEILSGLFSETGVSTTVGKDGKVIVHSDGSKDALPVTTDVFDKIYGMFQDLGVSDPKVFMSKETTEQMKSMIAHLPVSPEQKAEFFKRFNLSA